MMIASQERRGAIVATISSFMKNPSAAYPKKRCVHVPYHEYMALAFLWGDNYTSSMGKCTFQRKEETT